MVDYLSRYRLYSLGYSRPQLRQSCPSLSELYKTTAPYLFKSGGRISIGAGTAMVDYQSHYRIYALRGTAAEVRRSHTAQRELCRVKDLNLFPKTRVAPTHDCRPEIIKDHVDARDWEAQLLCHGLRQTCADLDRLRIPKKADDKVKRKDKLLFHLGIRGSGEGDFCYPRGLAVAITGDLFIADTANNRIQVLSPYGVFKYAFGKSGHADGELNHPTGVAILPNDLIVIADSKNRRIQVFRPDGRFERAFSTNGVPYSVSCDSSYNIFVGTTAKTVEVYSREFKFVKKFRTSAGKHGKGVAPVFVRCNSRGDIVLLDPEEKLVKFYSQKGRFLSQFQPELGDGGLAMTTSCISLDPRDQIILGDSLNHTVSLYTEKGKLLGQVLDPSDNVGPVQSCDMGPEGHLVVTEFSVTGEHCVKIFRFAECICHLHRPGSSKRRTLTHSETKERPVSRLSSNSSSKNS